MSLSASSVLPPTQKSTLASLLASRVAKRPREHESQRELQEAAVELLNRHQSITTLMLEAGSCPKLCKVNDDSHIESRAQDEPGQRSICGIGASLLVSELSRLAEEHDVPVGVFAVRAVLERLRGLMDGEVGAHRSRRLLSSTQRAQLSVLLKSTRELSSVGAFSPKLLWQEYWKTCPTLEVLHHLHRQNILSLEAVLESEDGVSAWLKQQLQDLCEARPSQPEDKEMQKQILTTVVCVLVRVGFEEAQDSPGSCRRRSQICSSILDSMLSWLLDCLAEKPASESADLAGAETWVQVFEASSFDVCVSGDMLRRFFSHSLTHILTHRPQLKVSDAVAMQHEWSFAKTHPLLTCLVLKVCVLWPVQELLDQLHQVLETHEVNWQHVLSCLSVLLVYHTHTQHCLKELLSRLLAAAFEGFDLESLITAFLLARQAALEGPAVAPTYSHWFRMTFGGANCHHSNSKKSTVFLLKFLSDLVPFDPPQYLKVHILHPPLVAGKHRSLLQEYVSLARTRLADLKVSVEEMGMYEVVSGAETVVQPECQAQQDVEKAVALFESTGKISATVMEASIFRRPYYLSRFLPALLTPRVLPETPDARMTFIEALKKAEKVPVGLYSTYTEACERERQLHREGVCELLECDSDPEARLQLQLQELRRLLLSGDVGVPLARVSDTLSSVFPERPEDVVDQTIITLNTHAPPATHTHSNVLNLILKNFCQCLIDASRISPPNRQPPWASQYVKVLLGHRVLLTSLLQRAWDLLHHQGAVLGGAHVLGVAAWVVELHACGPMAPAVRLGGPLCGSCAPTGPAEALSVALPLSTHSDMAFSLRLCVAAVCYGLCRASPQPEQLQQHIPPDLYKQLLYLIPRLISEARMDLSGLRGQSEHDGEITRNGEDGGMRREGVWRSVTDPGVSVRDTAIQLWRHPLFCSLRKLPHYQLSFSEWLMAELCVQRSQDALSDPERQEYERWACQQLYLPAPQEEGGCGGDVRKACTHIISTVLDHHTGQHLSFHRRASHTDTCLPDILSMLQELVLELGPIQHSGATGNQEAHFLLDVIGQRCSVTSDSESISSRLGLQQTLHAWNRVVLALPATALVAVRAEGRRTLDCERLLTHITQLQRRVCCPAAVLPRPLTAHFLRAILGASVFCDRPAEAVNRVMSQLSAHCPLLLLSAGRWWRCLSPGLVCQWSRLTAGEPLPAQLQLLDDCQAWASRLVRARWTEVPAGSPLLAAACVLSEWERQETQNQPIRTSLKLLMDQHRPVLVFLLFLCITDLLSAYLTPQGERVGERVRESVERCCYILTLVVDSTNWLMLFHPSGPDQGPHQSVTMVTTDENARLMPLAFCSLLCGLDAEVLGRARHTAGFLHTAVLSYTRLLRLHLDGQAPGPTAHAPTHQVDVSLVLAKAQRVLLQTIAMSPHTCLTHSQRNQLDAACEELDPEMAAALSNQQPHPHLSPPFSQELDFL